MQHARNPALRNDQRGRLVVGVHEFKIGVDPVDAPAVRVTAWSGTAYPSATQH